MVGFVLQLKAAERGDVGDVQSSERGDGGDVQSSAPQRSYQVRSVSPDLSCRRVDRHITVGLVLALDSPYGRSS